MSRYPSKVQTGLFFFVEPFAGCFTVVAQVEGYPATEACDDWFPNRKDAEEIAKQLADGEEGGL